MTDEKRSGSDFELPSGFEITVAPTTQLNQATKDEIVALCIRAFGEPEFEEMFDLIATAVNPAHVMGWLDGVLVSHATWSTRKLWLEDGTLLLSAFVDGVATDPGSQGRGLGSAVIRRLNDEIASYDIGCLSTGRVNFYANVGWELWTGPKAVKTENGIELTPDVTAMIRRTSKSPALDTDSRLTVKWRRGDSW